MNHYFEASCLTLADPVAYFRVDGDLSWAVKKFGLSSYWENLASSSGLGLSIVCWMAVEVSVVALEAQLGS